MGEVYIVIMYLLVLLFCIASTSGVQRKACEECYLVDYNCYRPEMITELDAPFRNDKVITKLGIHRSNNTFYYAFQPKIEYPEYYMIGYVRWDGKNVVDSGLVTGPQIYNFRTFDVDQMNNIIYAGGSSGVYFLDANNKPTLFAAGGDTVVHFLYKDNVYFVRDNENRIIEKRGDQFHTYPDFITVQNFVIDNSNHMVFLNNSGLFLNRLKTKIHKRLSKQRYIRGLAVDLDGVIYVWWINELYKVYIGEQYNNSTLVKVADIPDIGGLTFDNDNNIVYTLGNRLYVLKKVTSSMCGMKEVDEEENNVNIIYVRDNQKVYSYGPKQ